MTTPLGARDRILRAALQVVGAHGIAGFTNRRVARSAGVSLGSLTYHFTSQQDLLRSCLEAFVDDEVARITEIADGARHHRVDPAVAAAHAETVIESMVLGPHHVGAFELYVHAARDPELAAASARCWDAYDRAASDILAALGVEEPEEAARRVVALVAGAQLRRVATGRVGARGTLASGIARLVAPAGTTRAAEDGTPSAAEDGGAPVAAAPASAPGP